MMVRDRRLAVGLSLAAVPIIALLLYAVTVPIEIRQTISDGSVISLESGAEVGQSFTAHYPGLCRISIQIEDLTFSNLDRLKFRLAVASDGNEDLMLSTDQVQLKQEGAWVHFEFPPQPYATPATLRFYIHADEANGVVLRAHTLDMYPEGERIGGEGDLVFQAKFHPSVDKTGSILLSRLASGKPGLLGYRSTYILLLLALYLTFSKFTLQLLTPHAISGVSEDHLSGSNKPLVDDLVDDIQGGSG